MESLRSDQVLVLREYEKLVVDKHGDLDISVKDGKLIKLWRVEKIDLSGSAISHTLREPLVK